MGVGHKTQGTKFSIGTQQEDPQTPSPDVFTIINGIDTFGELGPESEVIDKTDVLDVARDKLKGIVDNGEFEVSGNASAVDPGQAAFEAAAVLASDTPFNFTLERADMPPAGSTNTIQSFKGLASNWKFSAGTVDGKNLFTARVSIVGAVTTVPAA